MKYCINQVVNVHHLLPLKGKKKMRKGKDHTGGVKKERRAGDRKKEHEGVEGRAGS